MIILKENEEWKEIRDQIASKDAEIVEKYGFDIRKKFSDITNEENILKRKKRNFIIKVIFICIIIVSILIIIYKVNTDVKIAKIQKHLSYGISNDLEYVSSDTNIFGNGFFIYKTKDIGDNEIHVFRDNKIYDYDITERYCKYYFEKWEDKDKHLFKAVESYYDFTSGLKTKKNWFLHYDLYLYADTEEEVMYATEAIIRFLKFMNKPFFVPHCYIQIGDRKIAPNNYSFKSPEKIRETALQQYRDGTSI